MGRGLRPRVRGHGALLAAASGVAIGVTFSPYGGPVLPFLAFAPLAVALVRGESGPASVSPTAPLMHGFLAAAIAHAIGLYWMVPALSWRTSLAAPLYLLMVVLLGLLGGAACMATAALRGRGWPLPVALATCWAGFEWAAAHVPGVSYAWLNAGGSLGWYPVAAAGAELLGARFLTFWTVAVGGVVGVASQRAWAARGGMEVRPVFLLLGLVMLPLAAGHLRQRTFEGGEVAATAAAVQAGHGDAADGTGELAGWLEPLRALGRENPFDVAVFPERFLAAPLAEPDGGRTTDAGREVADFAATLGAPLLLGALEAEVDGDDPDTLFYNAAFVQPPGGALSLPYRKGRLVPGVEGTGWFPGAAFGLANRGYAPGRDPRPLPLGDGAVGAMVCYDSAYGPTARALVRGGAQWLAVLSNDDWLDPGQPFRTTWAYWQHATHARLRAIENRISVIQVATTGYTFAVSPGGRASASALDAGEKGVQILSVERRGAVTLYTRIGDVLGLACFVVFALGVVLAVRGQNPLGIRADLSTDCWRGPGIRGAGIPDGARQALSSESASTPPGRGHPSHSSTRIQGDRHRPPPGATRRRDRGTLPNRGAAALGSGCGPQPRSSA